MTQTTAPTFDLATLFDQIHTLQARSMLEALQQSIEDGEPLPPSMYNAINKYLSDNDITGIRANDDTAANLMSELTAYDEDNL